MRGTGRPHGRRVAILHRPEHYRSVRRTLARSSTGRRQRHGAGQRRRSVTASVRVSAFGKRSGAGISPDPERAAPQCAAPSPPSSSWASSPRLWPRAPPSRPPSRVRTLRSLRTAAIRRTTPASPAREISGLRYESTLHSWHCIGSASLGGYDSGSDRSFSLRCTTAITSSFSESIRRLVLRARSHPLARWAGAR